jgi:hypothetical protein
MRCEMLRDCLTCKHSIPIQTNGGWVKLFFEGDGMWGNFGNGRWIMWLVLHVRNIMRKKKHARVVNVFFKFICII